MIKDTNNDNKNKNKQVKLTTITGSAADKIINALKRGENLRYYDDSVEGVPILDVYLEVDSDFWSCRKEEENG